jgi:hypothetical protein
MSGDVHVRICEGLGVRFPRATRRIVGCAHRDDAERFWSALRARLSPFNLELHPAKTWLIECRRCAADRRGRRARGQPVTFNCPEGAVG